MHETRFMFEHGVESDGLLPSSSLCRTFPWSSRTWTSHGRAPS